MAFIYTEKNGNYNLWNSGGARCLLQYENSVTGPALPIAVQCQIGILNNYELTLLDTAAVWSVVGKDIIDEIEPGLTNPTQNISCHTWRGKIEGHLYKLGVRLIADEGFGTDLTIESTFLVSRDWSGPTVLGVNTLLDQIRMAIDPSRENEMFYFGPLQ